MNHSKKSKKGFLIHAFSSEHIDYGKLAVCCALAIKSTLQNNSVTVIMDGKTKYKTTSVFSKDIIKTAFDKIIVPDERFQSEKRTHFDSPWYNFQSEFNNQSRVLSYKYSPYDETILLDSDYIVMNDCLDDVWGNDEDLLINNEAIDLKHEKFGSIEEEKLSKYGVPMYWATLVYFKKSPFSEMFFELVNYIRDEYEFFQFLYGFNKGVYRNDFSFSIAVHIINGYITKGIKHFPEKSIITVYQKDSIAKMIDSKEIVFIAHDVKEPWKSTLLNMKDMNVHIMNKKQLLNVSDEFIKSCMEKL